MAIGVNRLRAPPQERQLLGGRGPSTPQQRPTSSLPAPAHARPDGTQPTQERSTATPTTPRTPLQTCCPQRPRTAPTKTSRTSPADYRLPALGAPVAAALGDAPRACGGRVYTRCCSRGPPFDWWRSRARDLEPREQNANQPRGRSHLDRRRYLQGVCVYACGRP